MCLSIYNNEPPQGAIRFEKDEDGNYIVYKVVTLDNQSPFYAGKDFQWIVGENTAERTNPDNVNHGFHMLASAKDASIVLKNLSRGYWQPMNAFCSYKIIKGKVKPSDVIATGSFAINNNVQCEKFPYKWLSLLALTASKCTIETMEEIKSCV
jgi:hypothetical protein